MSAARRGIENGSPTLARRVLVTGSSRGIGLATALRLAADGFVPTLHGRTDSPQLAAAVAAIGDALPPGCEARRLVFDIADRSRCSELLAADIEARGAYYGVVCNAGIARDSAFPALTDEDWDQVLRTNLDGFYNVLQPLIMPMVRSRRGGRIVTLSSVSGVNGNRGQVNYSASKAGIIGASKALAVELASRGITVNCVAPGPIETDMIARAGNEAVSDELLKMIPAGRFGQPGEVAAVIAFLFRDEAAYVTRQVINVNGGMA
jgi:3-oxoacyl-[acyl-carrier protein] reductase